MVEQWPLKPLVEGSSPSGCTRRENQLSLIETLGKCRGFPVSSLIIFIHSLSKSGHRYGGHTYRRMSNQERSLNPTPHKAFKNKVRFLFVG